MTTANYAQIGTSEEYERLEGVCTDRAMAQWRQSLNRSDLDEESRVRGAIEAYKRQAFAGAVMRDKTTEAQTPSSPVVAVQTMRLSDGRADYYVSIKVGDRQVHPHVFRQEFKAAYHVALYDWLLNGGTEPDLLAFDEGDWPAQTTVLVGADPDEIKVLQDRVTELEEELDEARSLPWPEWASSILKTLQANGYDPVDDVGEVDLGEAFSDYLHEISQEDERYKRTLAEKDAEIAQLKSERASMAPGLAQAFTLKPLEWTDGPVIFTDDGPSYAEAVGAGYTYRAEIDGVETLAERKLEAEGRYLRTVFGSLVPLTGASDASKHGYAAIHAHTVRMAAHRSEENGEAHLADELRNAMRFIEHIGSKHPEVF